MAIKFLEAQNTLVRNLERRGFEVEFVRYYSNGPGRTLDVCLTDGVVVNLDRHTSLVWAEGPPERAMKVESFLRRRYETGVFLRVLYVSFTTVFLGFPQRALRFFTRRTPRSGAFSPEPRGVPPSSPPAFNLSDNLLFHANGSGGRS